jgi:hypothetical protein
LSISTSHLSHFKSKTLEDIHRTPLSRFERAQSIETLLSGQSNAWIARTMARQGEQEERLTIGGGMKLLKLSRGVVGLL